MPKKRKHSKMGKRKVRAIENPARGPMIPLTEALLRQDQYILHGFDERCMSPKESEPLVDEGEETAH